MNLYVNFKEHCKWAKKNNNHDLVGIWVIVCIQEPSHLFLQTFRPLRMFKIVFRDNSVYPKQLSLFCLL